MPRLPIDYSRIIIYTIKCKDDNITEEYIGSTINFIERKSQHKSSCNNENNKYYKQLKYKFIRDNGGWENWIMLEIEKYPCNDSNEARKREEEIRVERKAKLNSIKAFGAETRHEYLKQYYEEHKKEFKLKDKKRYDENKEEIIKRNKIYREEHKEEFKKYMQQYYEEHKEQKKQYYENNKEQINNKRRTQKWTCLICNIEMREDSKNYHNKTKHSKI